MKKEFGIGTISVILFILAMLWCINIKVLNDICLGDIILKSVNLSTWTKGNPSTHITVFYTFIFLIPAIILGYKFPDHRYAKGGKIGSIIWSCILIISLIFLMF